MKRLPLIILAASTLLGGCYEDGIIVPSNEQKPDYYIEYFQFDTTGFKPQTKVDYSYDQTGRLDGYKTYTYNTASETFELERSFEFHYENKLVQRIVVYLAIHPDPYLTYQYKYENGKVKEITERYVSSSLNSTADFFYNESDTVSVTYTTSNGNSFTYKFHSFNKNITASETIKETQLCSEGTYAYDKNKSPFHALGYIDFHLQNYSTNNKVSESVQHLACSFPTLVAERYDYEYDDAKYPTTITTHYKGSGEAAPKSRRFFGYVKF